MVLATIQNELVREPATITRHWSPRSENYATGDALFRALDEGCEIDGVIFKQESWFGGSRRTLVYHVFLRQPGGTTSTRMTLVDNPYLSRMIYTLNVQVVQLNERKRTVKERY